eukprot:gene53483-71496_t
MACGEGEEPHLEGLARVYDGKIQEMRQAFGEIGDMRLHVMAALMVADEASELQRRVARLEAEISALQGDAGSADRRLGEVEDRAAEALVSAAERIEGIARSLIPSAAGCGGAVWCVRVCISGPIRLPRELSLLGSLDPSTRRPPTLPSPDDPALRKVALRAQALARRDALEIDDRLIWDE